MSKIDFHVHITPPEISGNWQRYAEKEPYFAMLSQSKQNKFAAAGDVLAALGASGFDQAVVFGFAFRDMGLCRLANDYVIEQTRLHPGKLIGFMSVPPASVELEKEIERCQQAGLKGVGELFPAGQGIDIENKAETAAIAGICRERGLPLLVHANEPVGHEYAGKTDVSLRQIERFVRHSPGLAIVLAHWGGGLLFYECMKELREQFRSVYYDTAATPFLYDKTIYAAAAALGLAEKIIFGSDFPLLPQSRYMDGIEAGGLSPEQQNLVLGGNAAKLLKTLL